MFDNIGSKIKTLAKVICWLGIIGFVIIGVALMVIDDGNFALLGFLLLFFGPLSAWIGSFMTYGFGQLIENSGKLVARRNGRSTDTKTIETVHEKIQALNKWKQQGLITEEEYTQKMEMLKNDQN